MWKQEFKLCIKAQPQSLHPHVAPWEPEADGPTTSLEWKMTHFIGLDSDEILTLILKDLFLQTYSILLFCISLNAFKNYLYLLIFLLNLFIILKNLGGLFGFGQNDWLTGVWIKKKHFFMAWISKFFSVYYNVKAQLTRFLCNLLFLKMLLLQKLPIV